MSKEEIARTIIGLEENPNYRPGAKGEPGSTKLQFDENEDDAAESGTKGGGLKGGTAHGVTKRVHAGRGAKKEY